MPLLEGKAARSKVGLSKNIEIEKHAHPEMPIKQAVAISYSQARKSGAHIPKPHSHHRHKEHR